MPRTQRGGGACLVNASVGSLAFLMAVSMCSPRMHQDMGQYLVIEGTLEDREVELLGVQGIGVMQKSCSPLTSSVLLEHPILSALPGE